MKRLPNIHPGEVLLKVETNVARQATSARSTAVELGDLCVDLDRYTATKNGSANVVAACNASPIGLADRERPRTRPPLRPTETASASETTSVSPS